MTAGSLLTILFYAWLIVSAAVAVVWYRRRKKNNAETQRNRLRALNERDAERKADAVETQSDQTKVGVAAAAVTGMAAHNGTGDHADTHEPIDLNEFIFDSEDVPGTTTDEIDFTDGVDTGEIDTELDAELDAEIDTDAEAGIDTEIDGADAVLGDGLSITDADHGLDTATEDTALEDTALEDTALEDTALEETAAEAVLDDGTVGIDSSEAADDAAEESTDLDTEEGSGHDAEEATDNVESDRLVLGSLPTDEEQPAPDLSGLLTEFDLPYDLEPLTDDRTDETEFGGHIVLVSEHGDAAEVGTALADALVDIGYEFEPIGHDRGLAKRGSDLIALRIIPEVGESDVSERYAQSAVNDSSMVIEMWSGQAAVEAGAVSQV